MKALVLGATGGCGAPCLLRLLERGVEVTVIVRSADRLPAAAKGHVKLFEILVLVLERQGRLDVAVERCTNGDGATVLHFLADRGHAQLLSFVLKRDAFQAVVDAKTKKTGETALVDAARHGRAPCVHALLDGGARPEAAALLADLGARKRRA